MSIVEPPSGENAALLVPSRAVSNRVETEPRPHTACLEVFTTANTHAQTLRGAFSQGVKQQSCHISTPVVLLYTQMNNDDSPRGHSVEEIPYWTISR